MCGGTISHRGCEKCRNLLALDGREVLLKENAVFSSKVNQPILCYGKLMEHGWGITGREQTLEMVT